MATDYQDYLDSLKPKSTEYADYLASIGEPPAPEPQPETLESKYLDPYVYPAMDATMKGVSAVMKPATALATPILETARYGVRKLSGQDTGDIDLNSDLKHLQNPKASASGLMEDSYNAMGIKQNNLGDTGIFPDSFKQQFPKAYHLLSSLRPSDVAAMPVDAMLYGKVAAPAAMEGVASASEGTANLLNKQKLAQNILKSGSTDQGLYNDLNQTGRIKSVAQRIIDDPSLNRVNRTKVLDYINGDIVESIDPHDVSRFSRKGGALNDLNRQQSNFVESLPQDEYTFDSMGANLRAKELLNKNSILPSTKSAAASKIDEMIPFNQMEQSQLDLIDKKDAVSKQYDEINQAVDAQKMDELSKLTKAQQEAISKQEELNKFSNMDNPKYSNVAEEKLNIAKQVEDIQNQIDVLSGTGYRNHPVMKTLVEKRDAIASQFWDLQDQGFPTRDAYAEHIDSLNQRPIQDANDIRKMANTYKSSLTKGTEEYSAAENAANASEQASREAMDTVIQSVPQDQSAQYYQNQAKISDLMNIDQLYSGSYAKKSGQPNVPIGGMVRGAVREAVNLKGNYIDPHLLDIANKFNAGNGAETVLQRPGTPMQQGLSSSAMLAAKYSMGKGLVINLANYQIPRDTSQILANPKAAIAKVAQVTNNPQIVDMLQDALENHPEKLETILPVIIKMYPNLFESDKYDRVNGKILDPNLRQKAYQDVQNSALTNTQKIMLQDGLNRDGTLKGF